MVKPKGLGRGLDALLGGNDSAPPRAAAGDAVGTLPVAALQPGKYQPRTRMNQEALNALAASIKSQGIMQPILVRPVGDGKHEIIAGERRWRAARMAGLTTVPVLVRAVPDQQALAVALIENIQREDLNALEEAVGIERLVSEFALTHQAVADAIGKSRAAVSNLLRLLELAPPVKTLLGEGRIEMGHARALLALPVERQAALAREAAEQGWSVREVERRVGAAITSARPARRPARQDRDVVRLEEEISARLGTTVKIKSGGRKGNGQLVISYRSLDQLDALLAKLK
ncbi:MAG: ParB/RepB/Spo0J family partition protein [Burkholderiales bacterium]|nr:ParB/RepB/Spo0J family partition protein [Burkholderiales bacterium]